MEFSPSSLRPTFTANWHTHNRRCRHARGDFADYAHAALAGGLSVLGISDHSPLPDDRDIGVRMHYAELPGYVEGFRVVRDAFPGLSLHLGLELEWYPDLMPGYADDLFGCGIEYLAGAPHFFARRDGSLTPAWFRLPDGELPAALADYAAHVVRMIESLRFAFIAHPDIFGCLCAGWTPDCAAAARDIAAASRACNVPLEINSSGFYHPWIPDGAGGTRPPYPWEPFWRIVAEAGAPVLVNTDAHDPAFLVRCVDDAFALAARCSLAPATYAALDGHAFRLPGAKL